MTHFEPNRELPPARDILRRDKRTHDSKIACPSRENIYFIAQSNAWREEKIVISFTLILVNLKASTAGR